MRIARVETEDGRFLRAADPGDGRWRETGGAFPGDLVIADREVEPVRFLPPVDPPNVPAIGLNYREHVRESGASTPKAPVIFLKATTSVIGDGEPIRLPKEAPDEVDYEAELALVIGRRIRNVSPEEALAALAGITCANDVSARDCQRRYDKQWARAKSFDTFCPLGPWIVTDIDPSDLRIRTVLNGETMQDSRTSDMIFGPADLVSYLSRQMTLLPGTVILTGTPPGVGFARTPPRYLRAGDEVAVEIEGIGSLRNPVEME